MRKTTGLLALAAIATFGFVGPALANGDSNHGPSGYDDGSKTPQTYDCGYAAGGHSISYDGPDRLWPPNHRETSGTVTATGHSTDTVMLTVTGHDNDTNQDSDFIAPAGSVSGTGSASAQVTFVRERSGTAKEGRTYTIKADATFTDDPGHTCTAYFCVIVPHDMRPENRTGECTPDPTLFPAPSS